MSLNILKIKIFDFAHSQLRYENTQGKIKKRNIIKNKEEVSKEIDTDEYIKK